MAYIHPQSVIDDCNNFRELMGLRTSDPDELQELFEKLTARWILSASTRQHPDATQKQLELMDSAFKALLAEWPIRYSHMLLFKMGFRKFPASQGEDVPDQKDKP